jgi:hypothetical protein
MSIANHCPHCGADLDANQDHDGRCPGRATAPRVYRIRCRVSGGITGTRENYLHANGGEAIFATLADAQAECARLYADRARNTRYSTADFHYWPEAI